MDIWAWYHERVEQLYEDGQNRLVEIMENIPSYTVDGYHDKVDAVVPEGLALARSIKDQWVELFLRHWELQSLVLHRIDVKQGLPKAVSLLEFAHREENLACPQSICAVQDLANCYGNADGPGYVQERLDVASETMAKIDPSWSCYVCIACEYAAALLDSKQYEQALEFLDQCDKEMQAKREKKDTGHLLLTRVKVLILMERYEEAIKKLEKINSPNSGDTFKLEVRLVESKIAALTGRFEHSKALLLEYDTAVTDPSIYSLWVEISYLLVKNGDMENGWRLCAQHQKMIDTMLRNGAVRDVITLSAWVCELALLRGQKNTARFYANVIDSCLPQLHKVLDAQDILQELNEEIQKTPSVDIELPEKLSDVEAWLGDDPEVALSRIEACLRQWPGEESLVVDASRCLLALGRHHASIRYLERFLQDAPDSAEVILELGYALSRDKQAFTRFYNQLEGQDLTEDSRLNLLWVKALCHRQQDQPEDAKICLNQILQAQPDLFNTRQLLARIEQEQGNYAEALTHIERLHKTYPDNKNLNWDMAVLATLLQHWDKLQTCCAELGMELEGEGPEYGQWGYCRLQFTRDDGEKTIIYADRVGPVTARVSHASHIAKPQLYNTLVVFDPAPLNQLDQENEEGHKVDSEGNDSYLYEVIETIEPGGYNTFSIDGVYPGEENLQKVIETLKQQGCFFNKRNGDEYQVYDEQETNPGPMDGIYAYILMPDSRAPSKINEALESVVKDFEHPLMWIELAEAIGDADLIAAQRAIRQRYGL